MAMPHAVGPAHDQESLIMVPFGEDYPEIREGVRAICSKYPDKYWRDLEDNDDYAEEFVSELSRAGYLGALIPEEYGGAGPADPRRLRHPRGDPRHAAAAPAACHAQMYMMGTLLRHGSEEQKRRYLPGIADGAIRFQAFGVHRADHRLRHHPAQDPRQCATATTTSSTARRCGPRARTSPT